MAHILFSKDILYLRWNMFQLFLKVPFPVTPYEIESPDDCIFISQFQQNIFLYIKHTICLLPTKTTFLMSGDIITKIWFPRINYLQYFKSNSIIHWIKLKFPKACNFLKKAVINNDNVER